MLSNSRPENCQANFTEHSVTESCLSPGHSLPQKLDPIPEQSLKVYFTDQSKIRNSSFLKKLYLGSDAVSDTLARVLKCKVPRAFINLGVFALAPGQRVFGTSANHPHSDLPFPAFSSEVSVRSICDNMLGDRWGGPKREHKFSGTHTGVLGYISQTSIYLGPTWTTLDLSLLIHCSHSLLICCWQTALFQTSMFIFFSIGRLKAQKEAWCLDSLP